MNDLFTAYQDFWTKFVILMHDTGISCTPDAVRMVPGKSGDTRKLYTLGEPILLQGIKHDGVVELDIVIGCEDFFPAKNVLLPVRSSVHLHLFERKLTCRHEATHIMGIRFDYDVESGKVDREPLMHAHFDNVFVLKPLPYKNVTIKELPSPKKTELMAFKNYRLPTPRMSLPSVLFFAASIAKGQLSKGFIGTLLDKTSPILDSIKAPADCKKWCHDCKFHDRGDIPGWAWHRY